VGYEGGEQPAKRAVALLAGRFRISTRKFPLQEGWAAVRSFRPGRSNHDDLVEKGRFYAVKNLMTGILSVALIMSFTTIAVVEKKPGPPKPQPPKCTPVSTPGCSGR
jgi:hypothetical protein